MSDLADKLRFIESLRQKIEAQGKLPDEVLRKLEYKFRLECNYNSNKIEGGTLTKSETRSVMTGNITVHGKPLKDIREMKGHDEAMKDIFRLGKGERRLSEKRIRDIHRQIIAAETPEQEQETGQWKTIANHVINYRGEKFDFTPPEEVSEAVHQLLNWLNAGLDKIHSADKAAPDPLLLAFEFHLRYLTIHPFNDGNGRTARLLTNLVLVSLGYPPFWVKEGGEKDAYNRYLADVQAYGGSPDLLFGFLADLVGRSLLLAVDAIEGKDIEDMDDWKKKVGLLKNELPETDALLAMRSDETIKAVFQQSIKPAIRRVIEELSVFDDLFLKKELWLGKQNGSVMIQSLRDIDAAFQDNWPYNHISFNYFLSGYKKSAENQFQIACNLIWKFEDFFYTLYLDSTADGLLLQKPYEGFYNASEIEQITKQCGEWMLRQIEQRR